MVQEYRLNDGVGRQRRYGLRYRDGRYDREMQQSLGFGQRLLTDLDTGATMVDVWDNVTKASIGQRSVYPFVGQMVEQWQWSPGLPTQPNPNQVEMAFVTCKSLRRRRLPTKGDERNHGEDRTDTYNCSLPGRIAGGCLMTTQVGSVDSQ